MSGIMRNMFFQSLRPNGAILGGEKAVQSFAFFKNAKLWTVIYPTKLGRTAVKLGGNTLQKILHISLFDVEFFFGEGEGGMFADVLGIEKLSQ